MGAEVARFNIGNFTIAPGKYFILGSPQSSGSLIAATANSSSDSNFSFTTTNYASLLFGINKSGATNSVGAVTGDAYIGSSNNIGITIGTNGLPIARFTAASAVVSASLSVSGSVSDISGLVRNIPQNSQSTGYTLVYADAGKHVSITTGGVTVPTAIFNIGDTVSIYNNSTSNQTITQGASTTLRLAGTATTGNRTLAQYGLCTVLCVASNVFVITGVGLT